MSDEQKVLDFIRNKARRFAGIRKIVLFGSRARGDSKERSDFDFAVWGEGLTSTEWARFCIEVEEQAPSLCGIDLVRVSDETPEALRREIETRRRCVYDADDE